MSLETALLLAMLRLARRRTPATLDQLLVRVDVDADEARRALASLTRAGLVHVVKDQPRLTMIGFAIAVATAAATSEQRRKTAAPAPVDAHKSSKAGKSQKPERAAKVAKPSRVVPLVRRRRAA